MDRVYRDFTRDLGLELVEKTKDTSLYDDTPFNRGYRAALFSVLNSLSLRATAFGLAQDDVGLGNFSVAEWQKHGRGYWNL